MFTKSVAARIVSGALASVILPGSAGTACAGTGNAPQGTSPAQLAAHFPSQPPRESPWPAKKTALAPQEVSLSPQVPSQNKKRKNSAKRLGTFTIRAYTHYNRPPNKTASGTLPRAGRTVAVDPSVIPLGSRLYIEGIGELVAEDTGRRIKGKILDIFLPSVKECIQFGKRQRDVDLIVD